jgi:hypothetical protein
MDDNRRMRYATAYASERWQERFPAKGGGEAASTSAVNARGGVGEMPP